MRHEKSIELLNKAVGDELSAVHQYMYFHFHCDDQGYDLLANLFRRIAIEEMMHIEKLAERILFLKGEVELLADNEVTKEQDVQKMLKMAMKMEDDAAASYNKWAIEAGNAADSATKTIFENLVTDEEGHFDQFETQVEHIERFGEDYLALQGMERSRSLGSSGGGGA